MNREYRERYREREPISIRIASFKYLRRIGLYSSFIWSLFLFLLWVLRVELYITKGDMWGLSQVVATFAALTFGAIAVERFFRRGYLLLDFLILAVAFSFTAFMAMGVAMTMQESTTVVLEISIIIVVGMWSLFFIALDRVATRVSKSIRYRIPLLWILHPTVIGISLFLSPVLLQATVTMFIGSASYFMVSILIAGVEFFRSLMEEVIDKVREDVYVVLRDNWRDSLAPEDIFIKLRRKGKFYSIKNIRRALSLLIDENRVTEIVYDKYSPIITLEKLSKEFSDHYVLVSTKLVNDDEVMSKVLGINKDVFIQQVRPLLYKFLYREDRHYKDCTVEDVTAFIGESAVDLSPLKRLMRTRISIAIEKRTILGPLSIEELPKLFWNYKVLLKYFLRDIDYILNSLRKHIEDEYSNFIHRVHELADWKVEDLRILRVNVLKDIDICMEKLCLGINIKIGRIIMNESRSYDDFKIPLKEEEECLQKTLKSTMKNRFKELREKIKDLSEEETYGFLRELMRDYQNKVETYKKILEENAYKCALYKEAKELVKLSEKSSFTEIVRRLVNEKKTSVAFAEALTVSWINFRCITRRTPILFGGCRDGDKYIIWIRKPKYRRILKKVLNQL